MTIVNKNVDLGKSFEKLKAAYHEAKEHVLHPEYAEIILSSAVREHLKECTLQEDVSAIPKDTIDDVPIDLFSRFGQLFDPHSQSDFTTKNDK